ncbi:hypothetical protein IX336_001688 [Porphyromonas levii]|nr:hypothetical protein [Porphyromonas levii]
MVTQVIVGNFREVGKLIVVDIHRKALFYLLLDVVIDNRIRLT